LINPLSRDQSNKILFHDVFLMEEKEKLFNQYSHRDNDVLISPNIKEKLTEKEALVYYNNLESQKVLKNDNSEKKLIKKPIDDLNFRELIVLSYEGDIQNNKKTKFKKQQSLKDLELVVNINMNLEKSKKEINLMIKYALCNEENEK